ncbi:MAG TPA: EF-hand domain-containing protein [Kofleriaceae bacterium]|jgi:hypothetical protein
MKLHDPLVLALTTVLALAAGCKTDKPASSSPPAGTEAAKPQPAGGARPAPPSLPEPAGAGSAGAAADGAEWRRRRGGATLDKDGDGVVSDEERAAAMHDRAAMMHQRLDADGDGKLTPAELSGARGRMRFDDPGALDTNHDGDISADELAAGMKARADRRRAARTGSDGSAGSADDGTP